MSRSFVTVVAGVPRSGTSLLMQMLRAGGMPLVTDGVRAPDSDNPRGYFEFELVKRLPRESEWLAAAAAAGAAVKVIHALVPALPVGLAYRLLLLRRRLREVLASQRAMLERLGLAPDGLPDARAAAVFDAQLALVERWAAERGVALLGVDYNALVADPAAGAATIAAFLGGDLDGVAMANAVDPALYRRRARS